MTTISIENAKKQFKELASSCCLYDETVTICTNKGNVVMISEKQYNSLLVSFLLAREGVYQSVEEIVNTPTEKMIKEKPWKNN